VECKLIHIIIPFLTDFDMFVSSYYYNNKYSLRSDDDDGCHQSKARWLKLNVPCFFSAFFPTVAAETAKDDDMMTAD
jgi:hypothetical protein